MQGSIINFLLISALFLSSPSMAKEPLYFLPEKNDLQILPQKLEYRLLNGSRVQIGHIVIDFNNLSLDLVQKESQHQLIFNWPADLFENATLVLFNNYGKAIQTYKIKNEDITEKTDDDSLSSKDKTSFKTMIEDFLLDELKHLPFFKFCLQRKDKSTRIDFCSAELYLSPKEGNPSIRMRSENKKRAQILINNVEVSEQGFVFLNDISESVTFISQSEFGAKLEIETRLRPVDFKDIVTSDDGKYLYLTAQGSRPVNNKNITNLTDTLWQIKLPTDSPVLYIRGEGEVPFRQEFFIQGTPPTESLRIYAVDLANDTYSSSVKMTLELPKGITLYSREVNSRVARKGKQIEWTVSGLQKDKDNKRFLYLKKNKKEYTVYQTIYRGSAFETQLGATYLSSEKISLANLGLNYWINKRSGLSITMDQALTKNDAIDKWSVTEFSYLHRFSAGINFKDPSFYGSIYLRTMSLGDLSFSQMGLGVGHNTRFSSLFMKQIANWYSWNFRYYLGSKSNEIEIKRLITADYKLYLQLSNPFYFNYGLGLQSLSVSDSNLLKSTQINLTLGLNYLF